MQDNSAQLIELKLDIEEARALLASANRKRLKDLLSIELSKIETKINTLQAESVSQQNLNTSTLLSSGAKKFYSTTIRNYSWDQSDKFFKIYISLTGVEKLNKENIQCTFGKQSLMFRVLELGDKNHELNVNNFAYPILPEKSYFKVKTDMVVIFAAKATQNIPWEAVTVEEKRVLDQKKNKKPDTNPDDPSAGLMGLMKQMYDDGDDEMKRMLNKTWYESRQKTGKEPGGDLPDVDSMSI